MATQTSWLRDRGIHRNRSGEMLKNLTFVCFVEASTVVGEICDFMHPRQVAQKVISAQLAAGVQRKQLPCFYPQNFHASTLPNPSCYTSNQPSPPRHDLSRWDPVLAARYIHVWHCGRSEIWRKRAG